MMITPIITAINNNPAECLFFPKRCGNRTSVTLGACPGGKSVLSSPEMGKLGWERARGALGKAKILWASSTNYSNESQTQCPRTARVSCR